MSGAPVTKSVASVKKKKFYIIGSWTTGVNVAKLIFFVTDGKAKKALVIWHFDNWQIVIASIVYVSSTTVL